MRALALDGSFVHKHIECYALGSLWAIFMVVLTHVIGMLVMLTMVSIVTLIAVAIIVIVHPEDTVHCVINIGVMLPRL